MKLSTLSAAFLLAALATTPALSQDATKNPHQGHQGMAMGQSESTKAFEAANARMHKDMMVPYTGKTDVDFVRSMIPHHQGAVEMAKIELQHGKDPEIRKLAEEVIKAQEAEIKMMQDWLKKNGG